MPSDDAADEDARANAPAVRAASDAPTAGENADGDATKRAMMQSLFGSDDEDEDDDARARERARDEDEDEDEETEEIERLKAKTKRAKAREAKKKSTKGGKPSASRRGEVDFDAIQNEDYVAPRTAEDDAFIDDAGVAEEDKWANMSDDEDGKRGYASEAEAVSYTHLRAHETGAYLVCRLLLEKKN